MLTREGYKMFKGWATVTPKDPGIPPMEIYGTWLYKPDTGCWYCAGSSFMESIVSDFKEEN